MLEAIPLTEENVAALLVLFNAAMDQLGDELISVDISTVQGMIHDFVVGIIGMMNQRLPE